MPFTVCDMRFTLSAVCSMRCCITAMRESLVCCMRWSMSSRVCTCVCNWMISFDAAWARGAGQRRPRAAKAVRWMIVFRIESPHLKCRPKANGSTVVNNAAVLPMDLPVNVELCAAVLLPALLCVVGAELLLFAVAHRAQAVRTYTGIDQCLLGGIGAVFSQRQVVFH